MKGDVMNSLNRKKNLKKLTAIITSIIMVLAMALALPQTAEAGDAGSPELLYMTETAVISEPPVVQNKIEYNGAEQELLASPGTAINGTMQYALSNVDEDAPVSGWSPETPKAVDAGEYRVWYRAVGDEGYDDTDAGSSTAIIQMRIAVIDIKNQTIPEGGNISNSVDQAVLSNAVSGHTLNAINLYVDGTDIKAVISDSGIADADGKDVTDNYVFMHHPGKLTVKPAVTYNVTFTVKNGAWDNGDTGAVSLSIPAYEGQEIYMSEDDIPKVGKKPAEHYKAGSWDNDPQGAIIEDSSAFTYTYAEKDKISQTVTFKVVNGAWDDGKTKDVKVNLEGYEGDALKLLEDQIPKVGNKPADNYKAGSWDTVPDTKTAVTKDMTYTYTYAEKEKPVYKVIEGANGKVQKNSGKGLTFKTDGDYSKFSGIKIDNKDVDATLYDSRSGSTIVELKLACIDRLSVGNHTIRFEYTDGYCETRFEVQQEASPTKTPVPKKGAGVKTGDTNPLGMWMALLIAAAASIAAVLIVRRRTGKNR